MIVSTDLGYTGESSGAVEAIVLLLVDPAFSGIKGFGKLLLTETGSFIGTDALNI